jgi:hypothetical protein
MLVLDQCDDGYSGSSCSGTSTDTGGYFVCSDQFSSTGHGCGSEGGTNMYRPRRSQSQLVLVTAVNGNQVTISPSIIPPNYRSGQTPQAWLVSPIHNVGVNDLSISAGGDDGILCFNCLNTWARGVKVTNFDKAAFHWFTSLFSELRDNYAYNPTNADPYCFQIELDTASLIQNNIVQQCRADFVYNGPSIGSVNAYNFTAGNGSDSNQMWFQIWNHSSGTAYQLAEGNIGNGFANDIIHGSHNMVTRFRNYYNGWDPNVQNQTNAMFDAAFNRYSNIIGNVLGKAGYHTAYQSLNNNPAATVYIAGYGNGGTTPPVPADPLVGTTMVRWGNYDTVNNAVRFDAAEVPSSIATYANAVPGSQALPASFYLSTKPGWWGSAPWPAIGPDVTNGTIANVGGHANPNPAQRCYTSIGGAADGSGTALAFDANSCYQGTGSTGPTGASGLTLVVH